MSERNKPTGKPVGRPCRKPPRLSGRPQKHIDWDQVDELLIAGCSGPEIAAVFQMHPCTFYDRVFEKYKVYFTEYSTEKRSHGDSLIRQAQFEKALAKDNTMLVWLGKNRLGQRETPEQNSVSPEFLAQFQALMQSFNAMQNQPDLNKAESKTNTDNKSA